jgi:hypothetical protein
MKRTDHKSKNGIRPHSQQLWADTERSLVEFWRMIEEGQFPYTKTALCRLLKISRRWVERVVARAARRSS